MSSIDQQFVEYIAKSLVSKPDEVRVERRIDEKGVLLELTVSPEDLGRVIGKHGATAQSLRTLLRALGTKNDARYNLKIVDTDMPADNAVPQQQSNDEPANVPTYTPPANNSSDDHQAEPADTPVPTPPMDESTSSVVDQTRKELAELDDLDV